MAVTLTQFLHGPLKWAMAEAKLQVWWNRLNQIIAAEAGSGITGGTTVLGDADLVDGAGTGIQKDVLATISGPFAASGAEATVTGEKVIPPDPGGSYGPTPARLSNAEPMNGFRNSI